MFCWEQFLSAKLAKNSTKLESAIKFESFVSKECFVTHLTLFENRRIACPKSSRCSTFSLRFLPKLGWKNEVWCYNDMSHTTVKRIERSPWTQDVN